MNKKDFKEILKECIRELIQEGAFSSIAENRTISSITENEKKQHIALKENMVKNLNLQKKAMIAAQMAGGKNAGMKKVYEEIFADTANTTLQEQLANDKNTGATADMLILSDGNDSKTLNEIKQLENIAGDSSKWAKWAFSGKAKNKN